MSFNDADGAIFKIKEKKFSQLVTKDPILPLEIYSSKIALYRH